MQHQAEFVKHANILLEFIIVLDLMKVLMAQMEISAFCTLVDIESGDGSRGIHNQFQMSIDFFLHLQGPDR